MQLGYIGLGKMGFSMVQLLLERKHQVAVYDRNTAVVAAIAKEGAEPAQSLKALADSLPSPRLFWIMVPHHAVDPVLEELLSLLARGDTVIDGGNSLYKDSIRPSTDMRQRGIDFLDAGISGGPEAAARVRAS